MKKFFGLIRKKKEPAKTVVLGITAGEYACIQQSIEAAYETAAKRQKPDTKEPSAYMKGLQTALCLMQVYTPHNMEVQ